MESRKGREMTRLTKAERRDRDERFWAARRVHYQNEVTAYSLKPWDVLPMNADGDPPPASDTDLKAESWRRARAIRDALLAANPEHYRDIE